VHLPGPQLPPEQTWQPCLAPPGPETGKQRDAGGQHLLQPLLLGGQPRHCRPACLFTPEACHSNPAATPYASGEAGISPLAPCPPLTPPDRHPGRRLCGIPAYGNQAWAEAAVPATRHGCRGPTAWSGGRGTHPIRGNAGTSEDQPCRTELCWAPRHTRTRGLTHSLQLTRNPQPQQRFGVNARSPGGTGVGMCVFMTGQQSEIPRSAPSTQHPGGHCEAAGCNHLLVFSLAQTLATYLLLCQGPFQPEEADGDPAPSFTSLLPAAVPLSLPAAPQGQPQPNTAISTLLLPLES